MAFNNQQAPFWEFESIILLKHTIRGLLQPKDTLIKARSFLSGISLVVTSEAQERLAGADLAIEAVDAVVEMVLATVPLTASDLAHHGERENRQRTRVRKADHIIITADAEIAAAVRASLERRTQIQKLENILQGPMEADIMADMDREDSEDEEEGIGAPEEVGEDLMDIITHPHRHLLVTHHHPLRLLEAQNGFGAPDAQRSGETLVPEDADMENSFVPPIDVFTTENAYVLHVALPGAKKEDVGVHWDAEKGTLTMAGVVYRQGDEKFLESLTKKERKVGAFERTMKLPLNAEDKDEIDGDNITAKLEDGVLVVTVPKVEKEESWTEIKRVEIE
ncbi:Heat shock 16 protein [Rutstroemia sp. NJR-2017a BBW]|nr:Heat shock 16 protein [Rutstroemia sp. NJR-2017a BBW]